jgi:predicted nucleic acid-binding protein
VAREVVVAAARLRARSGVQLADAIHLASAARLGALFVTNDARLARGDVGIDVRLLEDVRIP